MEEKRCREIGKAANKWTDVRRVERRTFVVVFIVSNHYFLSVSLRLLPLDTASVNDMNLDPRVFSFEMLADLYPRATIVIITIISQAYI